ncbi:hypothetical protein BJV74DRAFT_841698, partial [Russula compacta]
MPFKLLRKCPCPCHPSRPLPLCTFVPLLSPLTFASLPSPRFFCPYVATLLSPRLPRSYLSPSSPLSPLFPA